MAGACCRRNKRIGRRYNGRTRAYAAGFHSKDHAARVAVNCETHDWFRTQAFFSSSVGNVFRYGVKFLGKILFKLKGISARCEPARAEHRKHSVLFFQPDSRAGERDFK